MNSLFSRHTENVETLMTVFSGLPLFQVAIIERTLHRRQRRVEDRGLLEEYIRERMS